MKNKTEICCSQLHVAGHLADTHIVRHRAYLHVAEELARAIANKAFEEPTIIRAGWTETKDRFFQCTTIQCRIKTIPFRTWAIENLRAGQEDEFGRILEIPLSNERMMVMKENFIYTK